MWHRLSYGSLKVTVSVAAERPTVNPPAISREDEGFQTAGSAHRLHNKLVEAPRLYNTAEPNCIKQ